MNKFSECIHCEKFFECDKKKDKPQHCVNFQERKDEKNGRVYKNPF